MNIVALETASVPGGIALARDGEVLWDETLRAMERSGEALVARLDAGFRGLHWSAAEVQLVGLTVGPGSFTGLRVGVTAAKILAYAVGCPVAAIDTMHAIAAGLPNPEADMLVVMDAQRRGFFCQRFRAHAMDEPRPAGPRKIWPAERILEEPDDTLLIGPGLARLADRLGQRHVAVAERWNPNACTVARLAWGAAQRDDVVDPFQLVPDYGAPSAAQELRPRKQ